MEINDIKLIMIVEYEKQFNKIFDKFNMDELDLNGLIDNLNLLNRRYNCLRVDIKNYGSFSNDIEFFEYDKNIFMSKPDWFKDDFGVGCQLECCGDDFGFIFKCINSGNLKLFIRGVDFRDVDAVRIPIYINFTNLKINDKVIFNQSHLVWHDDPYIFEKTCKNQQYVSVDLKFKTLFDYFPSLNFKISDDSSEEDVIKICDKIKKYIKVMVLLLNKKII